MPLPVWIALQQTMLLNAPCDISDGEAVIIILVAAVVICLIIDMFINK
mgnify:CR=1 FL=1